MQITGYRLQVTGKIFSKNTSVRRRLFIRTSKGIFGVTCHLLKKAATSRGATKLLRGQRKEE